MKVRRILLALALVLVSLLAPASVSADPNEDLHIYDQVTEPPNGYDCDDIDDNYSNLSLQGVQGTPDPIMGYCSEYTWDNRISRVHVVIPYNRCWKFATGNNYGGSSWTIYGPRTGMFNIPGQYNNAISSFFYGWRIGSTGCTVNQP